MAFDVSADAYGEFMGRYSRPLAVAFADLVGARAGQRALDVGCGPGALTAELARRLGEDHVCAVDPSEPFVAAVRRDLPGVEAQVLSAERLPYEQGTFDLVLAQLVVSFMADPVAGLAEMARVVAPGGVVAANVWDLGGDRAPLSPYWRAARVLDPDVDDESERAGAAEGSLADLFERAGMAGATPDVLRIALTLTDVEDYWRPFTYGVGPAGDHLASLGPEQRDALHQECRRLLPEHPLTIEAAAWTVWWRAPS